MTQPLVTLLTDFGSQDAYVGVVKGVILGIAPAARLVDLCHEVPPQDVEHAAFLLLVSHQYFPSGTVHLVVVDPGVGTRRRLVAVRAGDQSFVAPDNGVLRWTLDALGPPAESVAIENPAFRLPVVSRTFHGRDVLAPAAAHLSLGLPLSALGPPAAVATLVGRRLPVPLPAGGGLAGEVLHVDRFGNLITNVAAASLSSAPAESITVHVAGRQIRGLSESYQEGVHLLAVLGSSGFLEVAVRNRSAAGTLGLGRGAPVRVEWEVNR